MTSLTQEHVEEDSPKPSARTPAKKKIPRVWWLGLLVIAYTVSVLGIALMLNVLGDVWWLATVALFGPRWIWAAPLVVLVPAAAIWRRIFLAPLGAATLVVLGPVMGVRASPSALAAGLSDEAPRAAGTLRVMTYNVGGNVKPARGALEAIVLQADIALLQECGQVEIDESLLKAKGHELRCVEGMCLVTKLPIRKLERRDRNDLYARDGSGGMERYTLDAHGRDIVVTNLHLETVRDGLNAIRSSAWRGAPVLRANTELRELESRLARAFVDEPAGPRIVAGDFNLPVESAIYERHWADFTNTFSEVGLGLGTSKATRTFGIRIDHVLVGPDWVVEGAWVGEHFGSDHRPMIADVRLK